MAGFKLKVGLSGAREVRERLRELAKEVPEAVAKALYLVGAEVRTEAMVRAPLKYGALRFSAYLTLPSFKGGSPRVEVGFGVPYARYQHDGNFNHPRGGERGFLANAVEAKATLAAVAEKARELLAHGVGSVSAVAPEQPLVRRAKQRAAARSAAARLRRKKERGP